MKKILFTIGSLQLGGAETVLVDILNKIQKNFDIDLLLFEKSGPLLNKLDKDINVKYLVKSVNESNNIFIKLYRRIYKSLIYRFLYKSKLYAKYVYKNIISKKYDVEVAFLAGTPSALIKNSPNITSKKVLWIHAEVTKKDTKTYNKYLKIYNNFDKIVGVSDVSINTFLKSFPLSKNKLILIYNYVNVEKILNNSKLENIRYQKNKINIVMVGRLVRDKGYDRILKLAKLYEENIIFNIIGDGPLNSELSKIIETENIKNIVLYGSKTNPYPYVKNADLFLLSSRSEAYPTVVIEALVLNKFIIATRVPGVEEILQDYEAKIIVENSFDGVKEGIDEYLKNKNKYDDFDYDNSKFIIQNEENLKKVVDLLNGKEK